MPDATNGHHPVPYETAKRLIELGIMPLPLPYGQKNPNRRDWDQERYTLAELERFNGRVNVGGRLGFITAKDGKVLTNNFVDCDLDTMEAVRAAPYYLPQTGMVWGRNGKPRSHYGYRLSSPEGVKDYKCNDPNIKKSEQGGPKAMLCELRWNGQTVMPGSVNTQDGREDWVRFEADGDGEPSTVDYGVLVERMAMVGAVALLARYWSDGVRHVAALPLSGMLCRGQLSEEDAVTFMKALCDAARDTQLDNRVQTVRDTYQRARNGDSYTGANTLAEYFPEIVVVRLRKWVKLGSQAYGGDIGPDGKPLSDIGNAERFGEKWEGQLLHVDDESAWYYLEQDQYWKRDRQNRVYLMARTVLNDFRAIANSPGQNRGNTTVDQWLRHAVKMGDQKALGAMINLGRAILPALPEDFDSHPLLLNVQNGTLELDIRTGTITLRAHRPEDKITMMAPVSYNPDARHTLFDEALDLFHPDLERRLFLQLHAGYLLTGLAKRYSLELIGLTHSGKSMTLLMFANTLGDYAASLTYDSLMKSGKGGDVARPDLWRVRNKRLVTVAEVPPDVRYDVALFKTLLSGGDMKHVRTLYDKTGGADVRFRFALWTSGNKPYGPPPSEAAAYERLHIYRCDQQMPADKRREQKELDTINPAITGDAILAWMCAGFTMLYRDYNGEIIPPDSIKRSTVQIQNDLDPWSEHIDTLFEFTGDPDDGVLKSEAWSVAKAEREQDGVRLHKSHVQYDFEAALERRVGPTTQRSTRWKNNRYWPAMRWSEHAQQSYRVTLPHWQQQQQ